MPTRRPSHTQRRRKRRRGAPIVRLLLILFVVALVFFLRPFVTQLLEPVEAVNLPVIEESNGAWEPLPEVETTPSPTVEPKPTPTPTPTPTLTPSPTPMPTPKPIANDGWNMVLVNASSPIDDTYPVELFRYVDQFGREFLFDERIEQPLMALMEQAANSGINICLNAAHRTVSHQASLYNAEVNRLMGLGYSKAAAEAETQKSIAVPGMSEHHTGLAIDFGVLDGSNWTDTYAWLEKHAPSYGFILRYPYGKTDITGVKYEPWHFRYVGVENALAITKSGLTLEEYLAK